mmetsp:Transcript_11855/g.33829  ORF Transcript_11855/g.33829 Transcript_11855/m.33829 type:complete len:283 (+) Transcript_11855:1766-2614(+)
MLSCLLAKGIEGRSASMAMRFSGSSMNMFLAWSNWRQTSSGSEKEPVFNFTAKKSCHQSTPPSRLARMVLRLVSFDVLPLARRSTLPPAPFGTVWTGMSSMGPGIGNTGAQSFGAIITLPSLSEPSNVRTMSLNSASSIFFRTPSSICNMRCLHASECSDTMALDNNCLCKLSIITCFVLSGCVRRRNLTSAGHVVAFTTSVRNAMPPVKNSTRCAVFSSTAPPARSTLTWMANARPKAPRRPPQVMTMASARVTSEPSALSHFMMGREAKMNVPRMSVRTT